MSGTRQATGIIVRNWFLVLALTANAVEAQGNATVAPTRAIVTPATPKISSIGLLCPSSTVACSKIAFWNYSEWYADAVVRPKERLRCAKPATVIGKVNGTNAIVNLDYQTCGQVDYRKTCNLVSESIRIDYLTSFYIAFYGTPPLTASQSTPVPFLLYDQLVLFCTPLSVFTLAFSLSVIRKLFKDSSAHIFVYHVVIVVVDALLYIACVLKSTGVLGLVMLPLCYANIWISSYFDSFVQAMGFASIDALYCLSNNIQALLALDRFFALYFPVKYHKHMSRQFALMCIALSVVFNILLIGFDFFLCTTLRYVYFNDRSKDTPVQALFWDLDLKGRVFFRIGLLNAFLLVQIVACSAVFVKMFRLRREKRDASGGPHSQKQQGLTACYLLFGTCVLSFFGTIVDTLSFVYRSGALPLYVGYDTHFGILLYATAVLTPICSSAGFYVHCASSKQFRQAVGQMALVKWVSTSVRDLTRSSAISSTSAGTSKTDSIRMATVSSKKTNASGPVSSLAPSSNTFDISMAHVEE